MKCIAFAHLLLLFAFAATAQRVLPSDKKASIQTLHLYNNLIKLRRKGFLFGHQDDLAYGVQWKYQKGRSDIKEVVGDYPALYGWELSHLELDEKVNIDTVPFSNMKRYIAEGYRRGGVITISWHASNPLNGKTAWDVTPGTVASILPGGIKHQLFNTWLDKVAVFLRGLKGDKGESIPVLFRPFHELTGDYFWWGSSVCTAAEYKMLFRYTVTYLRDVKKVHNLLYVFNTGGNFNSADNYLERYPGDDVVDLVSFDDYTGATPENAANYIKNMQAHLTIIEQVAAAHNKIPAVGETGTNLVPDEHWWTNVLLKAVEGHTPAYVLLWRNAGYKQNAKAMEYYVPFAGQTSAADFVQFFKMPQTLFGKEVSAQKLYR